MLPASNSAEFYLSLSFLSQHPSVPELWFPSPLSIFPQHCSADHVQHLLPPLTPRTFACLLSASSFHVSRDGLRHKEAHLHCSPWTSASLFPAFLLLEPGLCRSPCSLQCSWVGVSNPKQVFLPSVREEHLSFPGVTASLRR